MSLGRAAHEKIGTRLSFIWLAGGAPLVMSVFISVTVGEVGFAGGMRLLIGRD